MIEQYRIEKETLAGIADKIRILSGTEGTMTTAQMDGKLGEANTEVDTQADLIEQIVSALEGKAAGSGTGGGSVTWESGALTVATNGMYEPGVYEYKLSAENLRLNERTTVLVYYSSTMAAVLKRADVNSSFVSYKCNSASQMNTFKIQNDVLICHGNLSTGSENAFSFEAQ